MSLGTARCRLRDFIEKWGDGIALAGGTIVVVGMLAVGIARLQDYQVSKQHFIEPPALSAGEP